MKGAHAILTKDVVVVCSRDNLYLGITESVCTNVSTFVFVGVTIYFYRFAQRSGSFLMWARRMCCRGYRVAWGSTSV